MTLQKITTLEDMLRYGGLDPQISLKLWMGMLRALAAKHGAGVFFGTLNPSAVLIDMRNNIVLVDSPFDAESPYVAPEVREGGKPDDQSDIFSMGVMLFRMLTGTLEGLHRLPPSRVAEGVPKWLDPVVMRCVMKPRSQRFLDLEEISQTMVKVRENLRSVRGG